MWFLCVVFCALCVNFSASEHDAAFKERAEIYSRLTDCDYYKTDDYNYTHFVDLSTLKDAQPTDYIVRVPVYVLGPRDGHIILSTTNTPNRLTDFVYEFVLGGWGNTKALIRKKIQYYPLKELAAESVISELRPLKVIIEITKSGHINLYTDNKPTPFISAYDPFVLEVKYLSFASYQGASVEFLYNCVSDKTTPDTGNEIKKQPASEPSDELSAISLDELVAKCEVKEHWEQWYHNFTEISSLKNSKADGYLFKLNFLVYGDKDVHILLAAKKAPHIEKDGGYEIVIGGYGNTRQIIRKTLEGDDLFEKVQLKDLLSADSQTRIMIQMTKDGLLEVFVGDFQYKPIISTKDPNPLDVKYVSFASHDGNRVLFFYNCDDKRAAASLEPPKNIHPLLEGPVEHDEEVLAKKCKHTKAWEDVYTEAIKLDSLNIKKDGYIVQLPVFVKGVRDAHILLTPDASLDPKDGYEILIGGWGNSRTLIRKHGEAVAKVNEFNVLDETKPIKVVVELSKEGVLRIFTDLNKSRPLLEYTDPQPIDQLNTLSFTAYYRDLDFYYGCSA